MPQKKGQRIPPIVGELLKYKKEGDVLDLGAGSGRSAIFLAEHGFDVTAVDSDCELLEKVQTRASEHDLTIHTVCEDVRRYQPDKTYDVVIATMLLHFFDTEEMRAVIDMMKRTTRESGICIVTALTDQNRGLTRPHLFREGELKSHFSDWNILHYEEDLSAPFYKANEERMVSQHRAVLMVQNTDEIFIDPSSPASPSTPPQTSSSDDLASSLTVLRA